MKYFSLIINTLYLVEYQLVRGILISVSIPALPPYKDTKKSPHFLGMWITLFTNILFYFIFGTAIVYEFVEKVTESFVCAAHRLIPVAPIRVCADLHLLHTVTYHAVLLHIVTYVNAK